MIDKTSILEKEWHTVESEEVLELLKTSTEGLSHEEAKQRLVKFGPNKLPEKVKINIWKIVFSQLINPLIFILIAASIASVLIGEGNDAIFIFLVIFINTAIGSYQEYNAEKSAANLQKLLRIRARIMRNGEEQDIDSEELIPGDLVFLESGSKVPADLRIIETNGLEIDESLLTGESHSVNKNTTALKKRNGSLRSEKHDFCRFYHHVWKRKGNSGSDSFGNRGG